MKNTAQQRPRKTVTVGGIEWTIISANERSTTHAGRHFFACRCSRQQNALWTIEELDRPMQTGAKFKGEVAKAITKGLSAMVIAATTQAEAA